MAEDLTGNEMVENMEYLLEQLHEEWDKSGKTEVQVILSDAEISPIRYRLLMAIEDIKAQMEREDLNFRQTITLSKESFVLLRLVIKVKEALTKATLVGKEKIIIELDREEHELLKGLDGGKEA